MTGQSEANIHAAILIEKGLTIWLERQLFLVGTQREIPGSCDIKLPPNTPFVPPSRLSLRFLFFSYLLLHHPATDPKLQQDE